MFEVRIHGRGGQGVVSAAELLAAAAFAEEYVAPAVAEFAVRHPGIEIELNFDQRIVDLVREGFDLAIRYGPLEESTSVARRIAPRRQ